MSCSIACIALLSVLTSCGSSGASSKSSRGKAAVGGTVTVAIPTNPTTLDPQKTSGVSSYFVLQNIGGSLLARDPFNGKILPYLASSWTEGAGGMSWQFQLRPGVKFSNGDPLTAADWAYTINRAIAPATASPASGPIFEGVANATAPGPLTLDISMTFPNASLLDDITDPVYAMPLDETYVQKHGAAYLAQHPLGVGPYEFESWTQGESIVLKRNPNYNWGPSFAKGPAHIQTLEFPVITNYETGVASLEAGNIDVYTLEAPDVATLSHDSKLNVKSYLEQGIDPFVVLNNSKPPFNNVLVRRAFNMAVNRKQLIKVVMLGQAVPQQGPISSTVLGYDPKVNSVGYSFNPAGARKLLKEAGYTKGPHGVLEKDGQSLNLTLNVASGNPEYSSVAQVLQRQYAAIGVHVSIDEMDPGLLDTAFAAGNYTMGISDTSWSNSAVMFAMYDSLEIGGLNYSQVKDPAFDKLLSAMLFATTSKKNISAGNAAQIYFVKQSISIPLYNKRLYIAINKRVQGEIFSNYTTNPLSLVTAYVK